MDEFLAVCQGLGLALAAGIGGALTLLFAAALASADIGWSLDGTEWSWVGEPGALAGFFGLNVVAFVVRNRPQLMIGLAAAIAAGAGILAGASFAEEGISPFIGVVAGLALAFATARLVAGILGGAARRTAAASDGEQADPNALLLFAAGTGLILAALSLFLPPAAIPAAIGLAILAVSRRRRAAEKYEGLRVLR